MQWTTLLWCAKIDGSIAGCNLIFFSPTPESLWKSDVFMYLQQMYIMQRFLIFYEEVRYQKVPYAYVHKYTYINTYCSHLYREPET